MAKALFDYYRIGIQKLLEAIGPKHHSYADALTFQLRLEENLSETDRFGEDPSRQAQRAQILDGCNRLSISATGRSFYYLCGLPEPPASPRTRASELYREATHYRLVGDLGYALQLYRQVQQLDPTYPRIDATIAAVEQETQAPWVGQDGFVNRPRLMEIPRPTAGPAMERRVPTVAARPAVGRVAAWLWPVVGGVAAVCCVIGIAVAAPKLGTLLQPKPTPVRPPAEADIGDTWMRPKDGMVMVYVPAGDFLMGSSDADSQAQGDEKPQHTVYLDAYWIDRTEVTNAQYRKCVEAGACPEPGCWDDENYNAPDQSVVCVSWDDAQAYAAWVGGRLPTEAEWEKAVRGTDGRIYPWGDEFDGTRLNYCDRNCDYNWKDTGADDGYALVAPVGSYPSGASPYGALDMAGNVWEWVADWYEEGYYARSPARNPQGPDAGDYRVVRGGSFNVGARGVRCACRLRYYPFGRDGYGGFRLVVSPVRL